jgi:hypothetical protein
MMILRMSKSLLLLRIQCRRPHIGGARFCPDPTHSILLRSPGWCSRFRRRHQRSHYSINSDPLPRPRSHPIPSQDGAHLPSTPRPPLLPSQDGAHLPSTGGAFHRRVEPSIDQRSTQIPFHRRFCANPNSSHSS